MGPLKVEHTVLVADIKADAILGMDFLAQHNCKLDIAEQTLTIDRKTLFLWQEDKVPRCCCISIKEDVFIPALHEM